MHVGIMVNMETACYAKGCDDPFRESCVVMNHELTLVYCSDGVNLLFMVMHVHVMSSDMEIHEGRCFMIAHGKQIDHPEKKSCKMAHVSQPCWHHPG